MSVKKRLQMSEKQETSKVGTARLLKNISKIRINKYLSIHFAGNFKARATCGGLTSRSQLLPSNRAAYEDLSHPDQNIQGQTGDQSCSMK